MCFRERWSVMKRLLTCAVAMALMVLVSGCKRDQESVVKDSISKFKEMTSVLKGVKDEASAKAASPKLKSIAEDLDKLKKEGEKMGKPSKEQEEAMKKKYEKEMEPIMKDFMTEMMRVSMDPKLAPHLKDAMSAMK